MSLAHVVQPRVSAFFIHLLFDLAGQLQQLSTCLLGRELYEASALVRWSCILIFQVFIILPGKLIRFTKYSIFHRSKLLHKHLERSRISLESDIPYEKSRRIIMLLLLSNILFLLGYFLGLLLLLLPDFSGVLLLVQLFLSCSLCFDVFSLLLFISQDFWERSMLLVQIGVFHNLHKFSFVRALGH